MSQTHAGERDVIGTVRSEWSRSECYTHGMHEPSAAIALSEDSRWGEDCLAYNVQIDLTPAARDAVALLQRSLESQLAVPLWLAPAASLHVSVYALAPRHWQSADKEAYWLEREPVFRAALARVCTDHAATELTFTTLRVTPHAVIALASDASGLVAATRAALRAVSDPAVPTPAYDIVHCTLARYAATASLSADDVRCAETLPVCIRTQVRALRLVRERVYPSLTLDDVALFPLR